MGKVTFEGSIHTIPTTVLDLYTTDLCPAPVISHPAPTELSPGRTEQTPAPQCWAGGKVREGGWKIGVSARQSEEKKEEEKNETSHGK